jgi:aspartate ammonia-lyase
MRSEKDSLGTKEIPNDVYYGIQTSRAIENFPVSGIREPSDLINAYLHIKKAAAQVNMGLKELDAEKGKAIVQAADHFLQTPSKNQFPIDIFQAGAGTSVNMNINEVLANKALEILGHPKGDYSYLSPNDHVNMAQSSNDTFPTASHIAIYQKIEDLIPILESLTQAFIQKGHEFCDIIKSGRTHLMDALPVSLGDEFTAYGHALTYQITQLQHHQQNLLHLPVGGTATGTGTNSHPEFKNKIIHQISHNLNHQFKPAKNSFEALQSRNHLITISSSLKELTIELLRISNDLRLLNSGPTTGLAEIQLPPVQPGSSIMPGKINPSIPECLSMICFHIIGNDTANALAGQAGQLELNVMTPIITYNILNSIKLLYNFLPIFHYKCIKDICANENKCENNLKYNPALATLLNKKIGYLKAAELAKQSQKQHMAVQELAIKKGLLTPEEASVIFSKKVFKKCSNIKE